MILQSFELMGLGLLGVFAALAILFGAIVLLGKLFPNKND